MSCSQVRDGLDDPDEFLPLIMVSWDLQEQKPTVAMSTDPWDRLSAAQEQAVFATLCSLALDFAQFAVPDTPGHSPSKGAL